MSSTRILEKAFHLLVRDHGGLDSLIRMVRVRDIEVSFEDGELEPVTYVIKLNADGVLSVYRSGGLIARSLPMMWQPVADLSVANG